jgi:hypothetical protein
MVSAMARGASRSSWNHAALLAACVVLLAGAVSAQGSPSGSGPGETKIRDGRGKFVPIPDEVSHFEGAYIDKRLRKDLVWIADHFKITVVEGFAGRLPSGKKVGCPKCHVSDSEHKIGLAVDIVPLIKARRLEALGRAALRVRNERDRRVIGRCDRAWRGVSRLAKWAEPRQGRPDPPFRWVGYDGDANHGCGDHLHLSWTHDPDYRKYRPSAWVETFR